MRYLLETLKHKWFVLVAGLRIGGIPLWRLLIHDWTKFLPAELPHYNRQFFGSKDDPLGFAMAWNHHESHNPHHWGYWIARSGKYAGQALAMPDSYLREMVADWHGAGRAYQGSWDMKKRLDENLHRIVLHPVTRIQVMLVLREMGF